MKGKLDTIVMGGGCFWCTEAVFSMFKGVIDTEPGYSGGTVPDPTYEQVCSGTTGHAEVLRIRYDPSIISLEKLLRIFAEMHDPTSLNAQGADRGSQYRSAIYYTKESQKKEIVKFLRGLQKEYEKPIVTEVRKLGRFYPAEEYHKNYFKRNPFQPYCAIVILPKVAKIRKEFAELLKG
ncbi:MAG: peptide-methionine (S)-S-oxide reductase MsrA [Candidatus Micrarchaeaceae archaeon]